MIYIISGTEEEAKEYAKKKKLKKEEWNFIPDSTIPATFKKDVNYSVIFVDSFRRRRDIVDRLLESRDNLFTQLSKRTVVNKQKNIVDQFKFNEIELELESYIKKEKYLQGKKND